MTCSVCHAWRRPRPCGGGHGDGFDEPRRVTARVEPRRLEYYNNNSDVLDARGPRERVWELEFLTELFPALGRVTEVQYETVSYHLDYGGSIRWDLMEEALLATTRREHNRLVAKYSPAATHG